MFTQVGFTTATNSQNPGNARIHGIGVNMKSTSYLRESRKQANLSQAALAERAQVSRAWVALLERGYRPEGDSPALSRILKALAEANDNSGK